MSTTPVTPAKPQRMSPEAFGQMVKQRYPQYRNVPDAQLTSSMLMKYPQYRGMVDWSAAPTPGIQEPGTRVSFPNTQTRGGKDFDRAAHWMINNEPAILGTLGGVVGGMVAGPYGAVPAAAYGGAVGEANKRKVLGQPKSTLADVGEGTLQGGLEALGGIALPAALKGVARVAPRMADTAMTRILGVKAANLSEKMATNPEEVTQVGKIMNSLLDKVPFSLDTLYSKIATMKDFAGQRLTKAVASPAARAINGKALVEDAAAEMERDAIYRNDTRALQAIKSYTDNVLEHQDYRVTKDHLNDMFSDHMTPEQLLEWKQKILNDEEWRKLIKTETDLNVSRAFRERLYGDLDRAIRLSLKDDPAALRDYTEGTRHYENLNTAEQWLGARRVEQIQGKRAGQAVEGTVAKTARQGVRAGVWSTVIGSGVGGAEGYREHGPTGAIAGALAGGAVGAAIGSDTGSIARLKALRNAGKIAAILSDNPNTARVGRALAHALTVRGTGENK